MVNCRRYIFKLTGSLLAYAIVLGASLSFLKAHPESSWRIPITLAPVIPVVFMIIAVIRGVHQMDEMHKQIQLEALDFAFCATVLLSISYGFLENIGFPSVNWMFVGCGMVGLWGIGVAIASMRYR